ncbi:MAG: sigma-70 family RNA polymerase sigma factor [Thermosediminibacteraceae bacterium]|nr:sigma-70 family RNA polymerase sigma factor [Thermosediminibacteraceae bacterium]
MYRQLFCILNDPFLAEDLAQEVFLKFYQNPPGKEGSIGAWLFRVAKNIAYNHLRGESNRKKLEIKFWILKGNYEEALSPLKEEQIYVRQVLMKMDERDRLILIMKHSGYSYEEIAEVLGVKRTSVGTLIARAHRKFKELYEKGV